MEMTTGFFLRKLIHGAPERIRGEHFAARRIDADDHALDARSFAHLRQQLGKTFGLDGIPARCSISGSPRRISPSATTNAISLAWWKCPASLSEAFVVFPLSDLANVVLQIFLQLAEHLVFIDEPVHQAAAGDLLRKQRTVVDGVLNLSDGFLAAAPGIVFTRSP